MTGINYLKNIEIADIFAGEYSSFIVTEGTSNITIAKKNDGSRVTVPLGINRNTFAFGNAAIDIDTGEYTGDGYGAKPTQMSIVKKVSKISGGYVLKTSGTVWELPTDPTSPEFKIFKGENNSVNNIVDISSKSADDHTLALNAEGYVLAWGAGSYGQLGNGQSDNGNMNNPEFVYLDSDKTQLLENVISVSAGDKHSVALAIEKNDASDNKGVVYTWGSNEFGQIGRTDVGGKVSLPVKTVYTDDADDFSIIAIDAGYGATSTLQSTGYMWTYGLNNNGQLGNLDVDNSSVPVLVGNG